MPNAAKVRGLKKYSLRKREARSCLEGGDDEERLDDAGAEA
jgi:hypothetical protein